MKRYIRATKYISDADAKAIINEIIDAVMNCESTSIASGVTLTIEDVTNVQYEDKMADRPPYAAYLKVTGDAIVNKPMNYQVNRNDRAYRQQRSSEYGQREYTRLANVIESTIDDLGYLGNCVLLGNAIRFDAIVNL